MEWNLFPGVFLLLTIDDTSAKCLVHLGVTLINGKCF